MRYKKNIILFFLIIISINTFSFAHIEKPNISSNAAILIENTSNKIVFEKNSNEKLEPASITKILTAILAIENLNLNEIVTVKQEAISQIPEGYSIAALKADENISVDSLLKLLLVHSANDAANVIAYHLDNSIDFFANRMNNKCKELNLINTHFTNPSGMHDPNHYSTAHDIAILMQYCYKNKTFRNYSNLQSCNIPTTNKNEERFFINTNKMILKNNSDLSLYYPYIESSKTGFTSQAQHCLASVATKNGISYTCVILSAPSSEIRFNDTKNLYEFGFSNYTYKTIASKGNIITNIDIKNGTKETKNLNLILDEDIKIFTEINCNEKNFLPKITLINLPLAPIAKNKPLGTATYTIEDKTYSRNLLAETNVEVETSTTYIIQLILLLIVIITLFGVLFWNKNKNK